jgi:PAS domain S-box-containing protein
MHDAPQSVSIDAIPQPIFIYDTETYRFLAVNRAALEVYGYRREEFLALSLPDLRPPGDVATIKQPHPPFDQGPQHIGVWAHRTKAGAVLQMDIFCQDRVEGGRRARLITASDVTARVRLEAALRESETNFRAFFEANPSPCVVVRVKDDTYTALNRAFLDLSGWTREEALGRTSTALGLWVDPTRRRPLMEGLRVHGVVQDFEAWFQPRGGPPFLGLLSARLIELGGEPHILAVIRDITERRRAQEERVALLEQLRQAQKLEAVGRLAGGVAHDFNNMLMVVANVTDLLLLQVGPGTPMTEDLEQIRDAAGRATALTKQLLAFSRKQVLEPQELDLNALVGEDAKMVRVLLGDRNTLALDLQPGLRKVRADPTQLTQVLLNLAINARDAMPDGGSLRVVTRHRELGEDEARRRGGLQPGLYVELTVSDSGLGMDLETQLRAFEPFFTTKGKGGTGLGLATVYGIVRQSGGFVELESAPGKGATFRVWLPALEGPAAKT